MREVSEKSDVPRLRESMTHPMQYDHDDGGSPRAEASVEAIRPAFGSEAARWFMAQVYSQPRLAHHPDCRCFDNHVLRVGSLTLCLGCTCVVCGAVAAGAALWCLWAYHREWALGCGASGFLVGGILLFVPTLAQPFLQVKPFKMVARFMLGAAIVVLWFGAMAILPLTSVGLGLRFVFVGIFAGVFRATQWQRARYAKDPCRDCPGPKYPFCQDRRNRLQPLINKLEAVAKPEDAPFVLFARALVGQSGDGISVEFAELRECVTAAGTGTETRACTRKVPGVFACFHTDQSNV